MIARLSGCILAASLSLHAQSEKPSAQSLDTNRLRQSFAAGKREDAKKSLETLMLSSPSMPPAIRGQCLRYLSAIYAEEKGGESKASSCMYQLLRLQPERSSLDLPIKPETEALFGRIRREFMAAPQSITPDPLLGSKIRPMGYRLRWIAVATASLSVAAALLIATRQ